jgi:FixJ family two-component response regulator
MMEKTLRLKITPEMPVRSARCFRMEGPGRFELTQLLRRSEAVTHLAKGGLDIVLLDMELRDAHGLDTERRAHAVAPDVPLIVITGLEDETLAAQAMKYGAQNYLIKGRALKPGPDALLEKPGGNAELLAVIRQAPGETVPTEKSREHDPGPSNQNYAKSYEHETERE